LELDLSILLLKKISAQTNESRRRDYLILDQAGVKTNRLSAQKATTPLVTFEENMLILAEAGFRTAGFTGGLTRLNALRTHLAMGTSFAGDPILPILYTNYVATDCNAGGVENLGGINANRALLREIMEEKYLFCFGRLLAFDDFRRIRATDGDIAMPIPINVGTVYPEMFLIAQDEINGNSLAPSPLPGLFVKTPVNK
jgi:hypothetical protein